MVSSVVPGAARDLKLSVMSDGRKVPVGYSGDSPEIPGWWSGLSWGNPVGKNYEFSIPVGWKKWKEWNFHEIYINLQGFYIDTRCRIFFHQQIWFQNINVPIICTTIFEIFHVLSQMSSIKLVRGGCPKSSEDLNRGVVWLKFNPEFNLEKSIQPYLYIKSLLNIPLQIHQVKITQARNDPLAPLARPINTFPERILRSLPKIRRFAEFGSFSLGVSGEIYVG